MYLHFFPTVEFNNPYMYFVIVISFDYVYYRPIYVIALGKQFMTIKLNTIYFRMDNWYNHIYWYLMYFTCSFSLDWGQKYRLLDDSSPNYSLKVQTPEKLLSFTGKLDVENPNSSCIWLPSAYCRSNGTMYILVESEYVSYTSIHVTISV